MLRYLFLLLPLSSLAQPVVEAGYQLGVSKSFTTIHAGYSWQKVEAKAVIGLSTYYGAEVGILPVKGEHFTLAISTQVVHYKGRIGLTYPQLAPSYKYLTIILCPTHLGLRLRYSF